MSETKKLSVRHASNKDLFLLADAAERFELANHAFQADHPGQHIVINSALRSFAEQADLYRKLAGRQAVAKPGTSLHEKGMALDIQNYEEAKPYLEAVGFKWGNYKNDPWHFDFVGSSSKAAAGGKKAAGKVANNVEGPSPVQLADPFAGVQTIGLGGTPVNLQNPFGQISIDTSTPSVEMAPVDLFSAVQQGLARDAMRPPQTNFFSDIGGGFGSVYSKDVQPGAGGLGTMIGQTAGLVGPALAAGALGGPFAAGAAAFGTGGLAEYNRELRNNLQPDPMKIGTQALINTAGVAIPALRGPTMLSTGLRNAGVASALGAGASAVTQGQETGKIDIGQLLKDAGISGATAGILSAALFKPRLSETKIPSSVQKRLNALLPEGETVEGVLNKPLGRPIPDFGRTDGIGSRRLPASAQSVDDIIGSLDETQMFLPSENRAPFRVVEKSFERFVHGDPKPRVGSIVPKFESDIDRALYIIAKREDAGTLSLADDKFLGFLQETFPTLQKNEIINLAQRVRDEVVVPLARKGGNGTVIPKSFQSFTDEMFGGLGKGAASVQGPARMVPKIGPTGYIDRATINPASDTTFVSKSAAKRGLKGLGLSPKVVEPVKVGNKQWMLHDNSLLEIQPAAGKNLTTKPSSVLPQPKTPQPTAFRIDIDTFENNPKFKPDGQHLESKLITKHVVEQVEQALQRGDKVTLVTDLGRKRVPVVSVDRMGALVDSKGNPWGSNSFLVTTRDASGRPTQYISVEPSSTKTTPLTPKIDVPGAVPEGTQIDTPKVPSGFEHVGDFNDLRKNQVGVYESFDGNRQESFGGRTYDVNPKKTIEILAEAIEANKAKDPKTGVVLAAKYRAEAKGNTSTFEDKLITPSRFLIGRNGLAVEGINAQGKPITWYVDDFANSGSGFLSVPKKYKGAQPRFDIATEGFRQEKIKSSVLEEVQGKTKSIAELAPDNKKIQRLAKQLAPGKRIKDFRFALDEIERMEKSGELDQFIKMMQDEVGGC